MMLVMELVKVKNNNKQPNLVKLTIEMYFVIAVYTLICFIFGVFVYGLLFKSGTNGEEYTKDSSQIVQRIIYSFVIVSLISVKLYLSYLIIRLFSFFQYERIKRNIKTPDKKI